MKKLIAFYLKLLEKIKTLFNILDFKNIKIFFFYFLTFFFIVKQVSSLEVTVPVNINNIFSKTFSTSIPGSTNIIIEKNDLENLGNTTIHEILDFETGIKSRSLYGFNSSGSKTTIDLRGMGAQAKSNVLILINGQKLNNIDMSEIDFASIPIDTIERIEVFKGNAASVLYGDGAIGGAINIITNSVIVKKQSNEIKFKTGSFNTRGLSWNNSQKLEYYRINTYLNYVETDGYRDENEQKQTNITSEIIHPGKISDHFFIFNFSEQIMSTPSDRSQDQLFNDRRGSDTPDDYINSEGGSVLYSTDYKINEFISLILNGSFRIKDSYSDLQSSSYPSYSETSLRNFQFTPRINHSTNFFSKNWNLTYGADLQYADYKSYRKETKNSIPLHVYDAWQATQSIYSQQSIYLSNYITLGTGFRIQRNSIAIGDHLEKGAPDYAGWQKEHSTLLDQEINYAFNFGVDYKFNKNKKFFGRIGNGFRYPNIDDRIGGSGGTSLDLNTQTTNDLEFGFNIQSDYFSSNISTFIIEGKNELAYDSDAFENINMNSTRRYGVEVSTTNKINKNIKLNNNFTFTKANYTSGDQGTYATDFQGNQVPLVPEYSLDSNLEWEISEFFNIVPSIKYQDDMRMESDDENFQHTKIPSYVLANLNMKSKYKDFYATLSINNIFNEKYHDYAVASSSTQGTYNAYPDPGREIFFNVGTKF